MTTLLKLIWKPLAVFVLMTVLIWGINHYGYISGQSDERLAWQLKWKERDRQDAAALASSEAQERTKEQQRQNAINQVTTDAQIQLNKAHHDAADAQSAADSLQYTIGTLRKQLANSKSRKLSAAAVTSPSGETTADMLAGMLSESDKAAGEYAAEADRARVAGLACEQAYDSLTHHAE